MLRYAWYLFNLFVYLSQIKLIHCTCIIINLYNLAEVGNCSIRKHPPTALGYKDPTRTYRNNYPLNSCTTNDNSHYEVHLIGIYGDSNYNNYEIYVRPRGLVTKPIILVLTSYETTNWIVDTSVYIQNVLYGVSFIVSFIKYLRFYYNTIWVKTLVTCR